MKNEKKIKIVWKQQKKFFDKLLGVSAQEYWSKYTICLHEHLKKFKMFYLGYGNIFRLCSITICRNVMFSQSHMGWLGDLQTRSKGNGRVNGKYLLCILTSFRVLQALECWPKYFFQTFFFFAIVFSFFIWREETSNDGIAGNNSFKWF